MKQENNPVTRAWQEYTELKKSNFTDGQIRKIAQIIMACAMEANDPLVTIRSDSLLNHQSRNELKRYKPTD